MNKKTVKITSLLLALLLTLTIAFSGCTPKDPVNIDPAGTDPVVSAEEVSQVSFHFIITDGSGSKLFDETLTGQDGESLAEVLKTALGSKLVAESSDFGLFVTELCGVAGSAEDGYWMLYINGEQSMVGISGLTLSLNGSADNSVSPDDLVEFRQEKFE